MTQEEIEKAADEFAEREYETNGVDRDYLSKGFFHGARWLADRLCSLPWDEAVHQPRLKRFLPRKYWKHVNEIRRKYYGTKQRERGRKEI